ncbi:hypothetical protein [Haploplasma axanthum]|uniref:Carbohydrate binding domain n=1 Tax=Haploplasma axanthum TaxID=29552 RepID=A0A449BDV3_HAPAX|nr:hypothetical protein [Haploplasma axanthum]VEU80631.1 Carbohydrate binding domain [Haploplasma axanthum]
MIKLKKIVILLLVFAASIATSIGVYAWISVGAEKEVSELITELDSTRIFEASMNVKINDEEVKYSDVSRYDSVTHMFTFNNVDELRDGFKVNVTIEAKKQIKVRFKIVEEWHNSNNEIIENPHLLTFNSSNSDLYKKDNEKYIYYTPSIGLGKIVEDIEIIDSVTFSNTNAISDKLYFAIIVDAIQYNYEDNWDANPNDTLGNKINISNDTIVSIDLKNIFQVGILRGILIEFIQYDTDKNYQFVYSENRNNFEVKLSAGSYDVNVYTHKLFTYDVKYTNNKILINIEYRIVDNYIGIHSFIFSPNIIREFKFDTDYPKDIIVYTIDDNEKKTYWVSTKVISKYYSPHPSAQGSSWEIMGKRWKNGNTIDAGKVVYYDNTFWQSTRNGNTTTPGSVNSGWIRLDFTWFLNNEYKIGDIIFYDNGYWLVLKNGNSWKEPGTENSISNFASLGHNFRKNTGAAYKTGDIVLYEGIYYMMRRDYANNPPTPHGEWDEWAVLDPYWEIEREYAKDQIIIYENKKYKSLISGNSQKKPSENPTIWELTNEDPNIDWNPNKVYKTNDYVLYEGISYVVKNGYSNVSGNSKKPNESVYWRNLSDNFSYYNSYKMNDRYSLVYYNEAWWKWTSDKTSDEVRSEFDGKNPIPGEIVNGINYWQEVTIVWKPHNRYKKDDMVIFAGHFWRAKQDINTYIQPGDVLYWERYDIDWNPNK